MARECAGKGSMEDDIKRMDLQEFRDLGYLQEVNRLFFYPRGLSLEMIVTQDTNQVLRFGGVHDYRDDPEGIISINSNLDEEKARLVAEEGKTILICGKLLRLKMGKMCGFRWRKSG